MITSTSLTRRAVSAVLMAAIVATVTVTTADAAAKKSGRARKGRTAQMTTKTTYAKDIVAPASATPAAKEFAAHLRERVTQSEVILARILAVKGPRTIANTLEPSNELSMALDGAGGWAGLFEEVHPDSTVRETATSATKVIARFATDISLNKEFYQALAALDVSKEDAPTQYLMMKTLRSFRRSGIDRDDATREKLKGFSADLVRQGQEFDRSIGKDTRSIKVKPAELEGLPQDFLAAHPVDANGMITITTDYPDYIPTMTYCKNADVRKRLYFEFQNRGYPANFSNLDSLAQTRYAYAQTLGYKNWADYITEDKMVGSAKNADEFINRVVAASGKRMEDDYVLLLARKKKDDPTATEMKPWDRAYYDDRVKAEQFSFEAQSVRPYFAFDKVRDGVLSTTSKLFDVEFRRVEDPRVWHPSVEAYDLYDHGTKIGHFFLDLHPRANKYKHAAHFGIIAGVAGKQLPISALVCNFPGGKEGDPGLMEHTDVVTFFHEFGHLLHAQFAGGGRWADNAGVSTERDFVEAPSQMLEEWAWNPTVLQSFASDEKGATIPAELISRMRAAEEYGQGIIVRQQMFYARLSLDLYNRDPKGLDLNELTRTIQNSYTKFAFVDGTHMAASFGHLNGYSAVYYTYMWSLVIAKDMFSAFPKDNLYASDVSAKYRREVLSRGGSAPAAQLVRNFLGRDYSTKAFEEWLNKSATPTNGGAAHGTTGAGAK